MKPRRVTYEAAHRAVMDNKVQQLAVLLLHSRRRRKKTASSVGDADDDPDDLLTVDEVEMMCTTAAVMGHSICLKMLVEYASYMGMELTLRAADAAASFHGRVECAMYLRGQLWHRSGEARLQKALMRRIGTERRAAVMIVAGLDLAVFQEKEEEEEDEEAAEWWAPNTTVA